MIPPGGSGKLVARVHTTGRQGPQSKAVSVETNDAAHPHVSLTVAFEARMPVEVWPAPHVGLYGVQGEPAQTTVLLRRPDGEPLAVSAAIPSDPSVTVKIETITAETADKQEPNRPGTTSSARPGDVRLTLAAPPPQVAANGQPRHISGTLVVRTNHPERPELTLPLTVQFRPILRPTPDRVGVVRADANQPGLGQVTLLHGANKAFRVTSVELRGDLPGCTAKVLSEGPTTAQVVRVESSGPPPAPGLHQGTLVAVTDLAAMPRIEVPVTLRVVPPPAAPANTGPSAPSATPVPVPTPTPAAGPAPAAHQH